MTSKTVDELRAKLAPCRIHPPLKTIADYRDEWKRTEQWKSGDLRAAATTTLRDALAHPLMLAIFRRARETASEEELGALDQVEDALTRLEAAIGFGVTSRSVQFDSDLLTGFSRTPDGEWTKGTWEEDLQRCLNEVLEDELEGLCKAS